MQTFKRLAVTVTAQINHLIGQIENHEAVADMALGEMRASLIDFKYQMRRLEGERDRFEARARTLSLEDNRWRERAIQAEAQDHERALECVRRAKRARDEQTNLETLVTQHLKLENQLAADVQKIEARFRELKARRHALAARESRAQASVAGSRGEDLDVFERWEQKVMRQEVVINEDTAAVDPLATEFDRAEERAGLEADLQDLLKKS